MHEAWSFRTLNSYVIGHSSLHPDTRRPYTVESGALITPIPDWLVKWMAAEAGGDAAVSGGWPEVHEDFDWEAFVEWLEQNCDIEIMGARGIKEQREPMPVRVPAAPASPP